MTLDAIYKSFVEFNEEVQRYEILKNQDKTYRITAYAKYATYVLVSWERTIGSESFTGQTLWQGNEPIGMVGGAFDLYYPVSYKQGQPKDEEVVYKNSIQLVNTVFNYGLYGLPKKAAIALSDPKNIVRLDIK